MKSELEQKKQDAEALEALAQYISQTMYIQVHESEPDSVSAVAIREGDKVVGAAILVRGRPTGLVTNIVKNLMESMEASGAAESIERQILSKEGH